jgi:hypothetical protein
MLKNVNKPMATCHDIGACLLHPDDCACTRACLLQARQAQRLAPGVIDGPYVRRQARAQRAAGVLLLLIVGLAASVAALVQFVPLAGWF